MGYRATQYSLCLHRLTGLWITNCSMGNGLPVRITVTTCREKGRFASLPAPNSKDVPFSAWGFCRSCPTIFNSICTLHHEGRGWALTSVPLSCPSQTNQHLSPFDPNPNHPYYHRAMDRQQHACSTTLWATHTAVSPGGHSHHPKTWDGFALSPCSLGSMDIPFISCQNSHFYSATLRLQKCDEKAADLALQFWPHIGRTTKPFLKSEIRCDDSSFSWLILTPRLWFHALSSFKWNYH